MIGVTGVLGVLLVGGKMERYERREQKIDAKKNRIRKHGRNIGVVYRNALEKRHG